MGGVCISLMLGTLPRCQGIFTAFYRQQQEHLSLIAEMAVGAAVFTPSWRESSLEEMLSDPLLKTAPKRRSGVRGEDFRLAAAFGYFRTVLIET